MAFVVEDDTGLDNATSYVDVAFADDYLGADWTVHTADKESALMQATEYVDAIWGPRFKSYPLESDQALEFPRAVIYDRYGTWIEGVPDDLKKAVSRYAQLAADGELCTTASSTTTDAGVIKRKKVQAGSVVSDIEYFPGAESVIDAACANDVIADKLIRQYTMSGSGVIRN